MEIKKGKLLVDNKLQTRKQENNECLRIQPQSSELKLFLTLITVFLTLFVSNGIYSFFFIFMNPSSQLIISKTKEHSTNYYNAFSIIQTLRICLILLLSD